MVRRGDVYGLMVEHFAKQGQYKQASVNIASSAMRIINTINCQYNQKSKQAYSLIEDMKSKIANVNVAYYINLDTVRAVEQAVGVQLIGRQSI